MGVKKELSLGSTCECNTFLQIYKKFVFRGIEVQFFSWTGVQFELDRVDEIIRYVTKRCAFRDVLSDKFVSVLDQSLFPRGVGVSKKHFGIQFFCDTLVFGEFSSIVGGNSKDNFLVRDEHVDYCVRHSICVFPVWGALHHGESGKSLCQYNDGVPSVFPEDGVHLPVANAISHVHSFGSFLNAHAIAYWDKLPDRPAAVLPFVPEVSIERTAVGLVLADKLVDCLVRHPIKAFAFHPSADLFW